MIDAILRQWAGLATIAEAPPALLHGDFVKKNVRVLGVDDTQQLLAIDWEFAGLGTPAADIYEARLAFYGDAADEYRNAAASFGWSVSVDHLRRLSAAGALFRAISGIYWETLVLSSDFRDRFDWRISAHCARLQEATTTLANLECFSQS